MLLVNEWVLPHKHCAPEPNTRLAHAAAHVCVSGTVSRVDVAKVCRIQPGFEANTLTMVDDGRSGEERLQFSFAFADDSAAEEAGIGTHAWTEGAVTDMPVIAAHTHKA
jgi:hypothetical protein